MILIDNIQNNIHEGASLSVQILIGVAIVTLGGIALVIVNRFIKKWDRVNEDRETHNEKVDRNLQLLNIKSDCTISGLKQMNGQTSAKFTDVYDKAFEARTKDIDWINKN